MAYTVKQPRALGAYLAGNKNHLARLCQHAGFLASLDRQLHGYLPEPLKRYCRLANCSRDTLVIHVESAAWAARLRYCTPGILKFMQEECELTTLKTIRIRVKPPEPVLKPVAGKKPGLSAAAAENLRQAATHITDKDLRQSLEKIAKHYRDV